MNRYSFTENATSYKPVTLSQCKDMLEISDDVHDTKIDIMLSAATSEAEHFTGQKFAQRTVTLYYQDVVNYYKLPVSPVRSITSIEYISSDVWTAFTDFEADLNDKPPLVRFKSLPTVDDTITAIKMTLACGYTSNDSPASADLIPDDIKQAILFHVYQSFLNRGDMTPQQRDTFRNMLHPYRVLGI